MITHALLLELGFNPVMNRPSAYAYKGVVGWFNSEAATFHFDGFGLAVRAQNDLRFLMWLIDHQEATTVTAYPSHLN